EDVPRRALGWRCRGRLLHRRSADDAWLGSVRRVLRDEAEDSSRRDCWDDASARRGMMTQIARNLTAAGDGFLHGMQHVILDGDPLYTPTFRHLLRDCGITPLILPPWSPNLNAFAERFVESIKGECLDRMVLLCEGHLRAAAREFVDHYHEERPHQGLGNELIAAQTTVTGTGPLRCRERLGGLLRFYYRDAA